MWLKHSKSITATSDTQQQSSKNSPNQHDTSPGATFVTQEL